MKEKITYKDYEKLDQSIFHSTYPDNEFLKPYDFKILKVQELKKNKFYLGNCRNAEIALWNGEKFFYIRHGSWGTGDYIESINHLDLENHEMTDIYTPFAEITDLPDNELGLFIKDGYLND